MANAGQQWLDEFLKTHKRPGDTSPDGVKSTGTAKNAGQKWLDDFLATHTRPEVKTETSPMEQPERRVAPSVQEAKHYLEKPNAIATATGEQRSVGGALVSQYREGVLGQPNYQKEYDYYDTEAKRLEREWQEFTDNMPGGLPSTENQQRLDELKGQYENAVLKRDAAHTHMITSENLATLASWPEADRQLLIQYALNEHEGRSVLDRSGQSATRAATALVELRKKYDMDTIDRLAESYQWHQNEIATKTMREEAAKDVEGKAGAAIVHSGLTIPASLAGAVTAPLDYLGQALGRTGQYKTLDPNSAGNLPNVYSSVVRQQVASDIEGDGKSVGRKVASYLYQGGMSALDTGARLLASGGNPTVAATLAGLGSFGQTVSQASAQGATPAQAIAYGTVAAGIEALTEEIPLDKLVKTAKGGWKGLKPAIISALKQAGVEAMEEEISLIGTTLTEMAILQEKASYNQRIQQLVDEGMSLEEAKSQANYELLGEAIDTAIVSAFSGGLSSTGGSVVAYAGRDTGSAQTAQAGKSTAQLPDNMQDGDTDHQPVRDDGQSFEERYGLKLRAVDEGTENTTSVIGNADSVIESENSVPYNEITAATKNNNSQITVTPGRVILEHPQTNLSNKDARWTEAQKIAAETGRNITFYTENDGRDGYISGDETYINTESELSVREAIVKLTGNNTENSQNVTEIQKSGMGLSDGASMSLAAQLRKKQNNNGGMDHGTETELQHSTTLNARTGNDISDGRKRRYAGTGAGEQAGVLASSPEQRRSAYTDRSRATVARQNYARSLRLEKVSSLDLGLKNGTEARNIQIMPQENWDAEMSQLADRIYNETGKGVTYVMGRIQIRGTGGNVGYARGVITGDRIIVQADHLRLSMEQIADHEAYHAKVDFSDGRLNDEIRRHIVETFSEEQFHQVLDKYIVGMRGVIDVNEAETVDEFETAVRQIEEEIFADAYAGINAFGAGADQFTDAVNERMDQLNMGKIQSQDNGTEEPTGPPAERYSADDIQGADVEILRSIGRKSINEFTTEDIQRSEKWAHKFYNELGVKSPFFRAWFGDWRAGDTSPVSVIQLDGKKTSPAGKATNKDTGKAISWGRDYFREAGSHQRSGGIASEIVGNAVEIVENAVYFDTVVSMPTSKSKMPNTAFMHHMYVLAEYEGYTYLEKLYVEEALNNKGTEVFTRAYTLKDIKKVAQIPNSVLSGNGGLTGGTSATDISVADLFDLVKKYDPEFKPKPASKAVNEDGSPKIYYHGTNADWTAYDLSKNVNQMWGDGIYLAETEQRARAYGDRVIPLYVQALYNNRDAKRLGTQRDHIKMKNGDLLVFSPTQIKSATDNIGTFDGGNPDIRYSVDDSGENYDALESEFQSQQKKAKETFLRERLGDEGYERYKADRLAKADQKKKDTKEREQVRRQVETNKRKLHVEAETAKINKEEERRLHEETKPVRAKRELRNTMLNLFSVPTGQRAELGTMIDSFAERIIKNGNLTEDDRKHFFNRMYESGVMTVPAADYFAMGRDAVAGGKIYVDDSIRADFGDDWGMFRRRAFAAGVYLTSNRADAGVDMWNHELSGILSGLFDSEETDNRAILERIVQIADEGKDEKVSLAEYTARLAEIECISEDEFLDSMERQMDWALRTFAEKADIEIKTRKRDIRKYAATQRQNIQLQAQLAAERQERREKTQRAKERRELRELQQRTLKQLQWLSKNRNRVPEELQTTWDEVLGDIDLYAISAANEMRWSDKHNATWKDLAQMYKDAMKNDPNFLPSKELERIVTRLDATKIADMDLGALQDLYKAAIGLRTEFYNRNNVINDEMQRLFAEVYTDAKREIESAPGGFTGGVADKFLNLDQLTPMNVLQRMAGWDPDGAFYSMAKQLERGERDMRAYSVKAQKMLQDFLTEHEDWVKKADGQGKDAIWYEVEVPQLLELGMGDKPIFGPTVKVYMTPAQKVHMYLESKNLDNLRHMTGGRTFVNRDLYSQGKRQEALSQGRTIKLAPETVRKLVSDLTPEEMELAQILDRYYNTFATQEINKVSNILYGYDKAMGKNYAPIYTNRNYTKTEFGVFDTTAEGVGNLKGRQYAVNPSYNISAFDAFERHVDQTARFCGMAIPARNWTTLMNWREKNNSTGDVITHKWGEESKRYITDLITTLQAGDDAKSDTISSGLSKLQSNYITAIFGANPSIVLKQLGSIPLAGAYLNARNMPTPAQISKIDRSLISKYTQELEWRTMGYATPETKQLKDNPNWTQTNKAFKFVFGGGAITAMDGWAASTLWPWAENKVRREHPELAVGTKAQIDAGESAFYKKVAEEFEIAVSRSQSVSDEIHQGTLRKSKNPITKAFTMFRSDSAQTYNALRQKIGEARYYMRTGAKEKVVQTAKKAAGTAFVAMLLNAAWSEAISFLMALWKNKGKYYRDDEDELTLLSVAGEMVSNMLGSYAGVVTGGEELFELIGNIITGDTWYGIETPGMEQLNDLLDTLIESGSGMRDLVAGGWDVLKNGGNLGDYFSKHSGEMLGGIKDLAKAAAMYLSGMPASNLEAYLTGAMKWISPELGAAYDDLFAETGKSDLAGMEADALEGRVGRILSDRNVSESDDTAAALAALYEAGYKTAIPSDTPTSVSIDGEKHSLGDYQQQAYDTIWGGIVGDALDDMVASDSFKEADLKTQAKMLSNLYTYAAERAKAELFDEYELDSSTEKNAAIVAAGANVAECITWNTITSEMKSGEKSAELASWDIPERAKREIFLNKISDSREDTIAAFDEAGLSFDQFLQAYSMYGQINNEDLKPGMKAVEFSHWVNAQDYTAEQAEVIKNELVYYNMSSASSGKYDKFVAAGVDPDDAYNLTKEFDDLEPEVGEDHVTDVQEWRWAVDRSSTVAGQLSILKGVMKDSQFAKAETATVFDISLDAYVGYYEIRAKYDSDGNGSYTQKEVKAAIDSMGKYRLTNAEKAALWQLVTGAKSAKNNPYSTSEGQRVIDYLNAE